MTVIGIDIGGTSIKGALVDAASRKILSQTAQPTCADEGLDRVVGQIHKVVAALLALPGGAESRGIGIGVPGSVDVARGLVLHPPNLRGWEEVPLGALIADAWALPVSLDNDANCAALGEATFGAGSGIRDFIALTLGTGVGSGIILDGRIHHGARGYGGEFGHMTIDYNGPMCGCGNYGCVEAYVGNSYIVARARADIAAHPESALYAVAMQHPEDVTPKLIAEAAQSGDSCAQRVLYDTGDKLGVAIASAANLLDVTTFIIGGGVSAAGAPLFDGIMSGARTRVLRVHRDDLRILPAALGNDAGVLGAASLVLTAG
ncbi:MAG: ROK family protein [Ignavibacteriae bacterium]|nr:ROK family protein [Ignavibacteriota bacterium]